eukprot:1097527-Amorphochlora_amoeboformis.AAC.1
MAIKLRTQAAYRRNTAFSSKTTLIPIKNEAYTAKARLNLERGDVMHSTHQKVIPGEPRGSPGTPVIEKAGIPVAITGSGLWRLWSLGSAPDKLNI